MRIDPRLVGPDARSIRPDADDPAAVSSTLSMASRPGHWSGPVRTLGPNPGQRKYREHRRRNRSEGKAADQPQCVCLARVGSHPAHLGQCRVQQIRTDRDIERKPEDQSSGVISEPPPTPVTPIAKPTLAPARM